MLHGREISWRSHCRWFMAASALFAGLGQVASAQALEVKLTQPTAQQFAWHEQERIMFVCLDPCTWQGREQDCTI
jgi:hypothetical protein